MKIEITPTVRDCLKASLRAEGHTPSALLQANVKATFISPAEYGIYDGPCEVRPDFAGATLETKQKLLRENITVDPIEVQRVSNQSGGTTVYIGGIFDG